MADIVCNQVGALVSVNDFIGRPARGLAEGETLTTGKYQFRYCYSNFAPKRMSSFLSWLTTCS